MDLLRVKCCGCCIVTVALKGNQILGVGEFIIALINAFFDIKNARDNLYQLLAQALKSSPLSAEAQEILSATLSIAILILAVCLFAAIIIGIIKTCKLKYCRHKIVQLLHNMNRNYKNDIFVRKHSKVELGILGTHIRLIVDDLAERLSTYYFFRKNVSVCIKLLYASNDIEANTQFYTYARSENTRESRNDVDADSDGRCLHKVSETSYYDSILSGRVRFFASGHLWRSETTRNLLNKIAGNLRLPSNWRMLPLKNSHEKYWKRYKSTIVFPIRIEKKYLEKQTTSVGEKGGYDFIGFLCIDTKNNMRRWHMKNQEQPQPFSIMFGRDYWLLCLLETISNTLYYYLDWIHNIESGTEDDANFVGNMLK